MWAASPTCSTTASSSGFGGGARAAPPVRRRPRQGDDSCGSTLKHQLSNEGVFGQERDVQIRHRGETCQHPALGSGRPRPASGPTGPLSAPARKPAAGASAPAGPAPPVAQLTPVALSRCEGSGQGDCQPLRRLRRPGGGSGAQETGRITIQPASIPAPALRRGSAVEGKRWPSGVAPPGDL